MVCFMNLNLLIQSSVRHALYQKWFKKIRFGSPWISTKGCYWTTNRQAVMNTVPAAAPRNCLVTNEGLRTRLYSMHFLCLYQQKYI